MGVGLPGPSRAASALKLLGQRTVVGFDLVAVVRQETFDHARLHLVSHAFGQSYPTRYVAMPEDLASRHWQHGSSNRWVYPRQFRLRIRVCRHWVLDLLDQSSDWFRLHRRSRADLHRTMDSWKSFAIVNRRWLICPKREAADLSNSNSDSVRLDSYQIERAALGRFFVNQSSKDQTGETVNWRAFAATVQSVHPSDERYLPAGRSIRRLSRCVSAHRPRASCPAGQIGVVQVLSEDRAKDRHLVHRRDAGEARVSVLASMPRTMNRPCHGEPIRI